MLDFSFVPRLSMPWFYSCNCGHGHYYITLHCHADFVPCFSSKPTVPIHMVSDQHASAHLQRQKNRFCWFSPTNSPGRSWMCWSLLIDYCHGQDQPCPPPQLWRSGHGRPWYEATLWNTISHGPVYPQDAELVHSGLMPRTFWPQFEDLANFLKHSSL